MGLKKIFTVLAAAAAVLTMTSCGENADNGTQKKVLTVYALIGSDDLKNAISEFNAQSDTYQAELVDYHDIYESDYSSRFTADISAGRHADILYSMYCPVESYGKNGLLADLYGFMDCDPDFDRSELSDGMLKAYEQDGRLYKAVSGFRVNTIAGKTSVIGSRQGITSDEFIELMKKYPDNPLGASSGDMLEILAEYGYKSYIDGGKCSFDSGGFLKLLEYCGSLPERVSEENGDAEIMSMLRSGEMPFYGMTIDSFRNIRELEQGIFGEPVTFMGYPDAGGNGSVAVSWAIQFSIFESSENKDGAWEFVKYFYSEEYQDGYFCDPLKNGGYFPIRVSTLEKLAEEAKKPVKGIDSGKSYEPYFYAANGEAIPIGVNTDEDNQKVYELLNGAVFTEPNYEIINIIKEESAAYFSGQKSAEDAAEIIQNRVQNYLDENR